MFMAVMELGDVRMIMSQGKMTMRMCVRLLNRAPSLMFMVVVVLVHMSMVMQDLRMDVEMSMMGSEQQRHAHRHHGHGDDFTRSPAFT